MVRLKIRSDQSTLFISLIPNIWASVMSIIRSAMAFCNCFTIASRICFPRQVRIAILNARKTMGSPTIRITVIRTIPLSLSVPRLPPMVKLPMAHRLSGNYNKKGHLLRSCSRGAAPRPVHGIAQAKAHVTINACRMTWFYNFKKTLPINNWNKSCLINIKIIFNLILTNGKVFCQIQLWMHMVKNMQ